MEISGKRKRRTRSHVIADLSVNFTERVFLKRGHSVTVCRADYGIDLFVQPHDAGGRVMNGQIFLQLKASDNLAFSRTRDFLSIPVDLRDYNYWTGWRFPMYLVAYDAYREAAYWLCMQDYARDAVVRDIPPGAKSIVVRIPTTQRLDETAVDLMSAKLVDDLDRSLEGRNP